ncbi:MAG: hypothetical protein K2O97_05110 [Acetatifactor sp.]|nr:hypothetical protein [Acetatifactor sp.]
MKRKLKCYLAYTTLTYRILGVVLIPCAFWLLCVAALWSKYGGIMGAVQPDSAGNYTFYIWLCMYMVFYEIYTDYWVLGGCFSDAGKGLRYFRTSCRGEEVIRNIAAVDLLRRFLYCMIFSGIIFLFTGWESAIVAGLVMYCVIVGVLNGSRHYDGLQRSSGIAILSQVVLALINTLNIILLDLAEGWKAVMLTGLILLYGVLAFCLSRLMVLSIVILIRGGKD